MIVWLGGNNCLGTVVQLSIKETESSPPEELFSDHNLWKPQSFEKEYDQLTEHILEIGAEHTYVATVPHVTIVPISRGVMKDRGRLPDDEKYYDYYTHFFIHDKEFDPNRDNCLTKAEAEHIDEYIDQYNTIITEVAHKNNWHVVDTCKLLDDFAVRRNHGTPKRRPPSALSDLTTKFFEINRNGTIKNGGLIGLDGVHPTYCGNSLVAEEFINVMRNNDTIIRDVDFRKVRQQDTLVSNPPKTLDDIFGMLETVERFFHVSQWLGIH